MYENRLTKSMRTIKFLHSNGTKFVRFLRYLTKVHQCVTYQWKTLVILYVFLVVFIVMHGPKLLSLLVVKNVLSSFTSAKAIK